MCPLYSGGRYLNYASENPLRYVSSAKSIKLYEWINWFKENFCYMHTYVTPEWNALSWHKTTVPAQYCKKLTITWIGHATTLIQVNDLAILTDPVFGDISDYPRESPPGVSLGNLPNIDVILISHNHKDHLDEASMQDLLIRFPNVFVLIPQGVAPLLISWGFKAEQIKEHMWWQRGRVVEADITFTFVPAFYWSSCAGSGSINGSLWGGWVFECGTQDGKKTVYFAGDTACHRDYFESIRKTFGVIDVALLPIGPTEPGELLTDTHMSGGDVFRAAIMVNARCVIPIHWGTFCQGTDSWETPLLKLEAAIQLHPEFLETLDLRLFLFGESYTVS